MSDLKYLDVKSDCAFDVANGGRADRPLVTFALFAYNQEQFIRDAVYGALAQDYEPLEIILSDDFSTDRTFEIMKEMAAAYTGPHRIRLNRNEINLGACGLGAHVNRVIYMAEGGLVVLAAGDDISLPQRTKALVQTWVEYGKPSGSLYSAAETFTADPAEVGSVIRGAKNFSNQSVVQCVRSGAIGVLGASHAVTTDLFKFFGPLPEETLFEDRTLVFRSFLAGIVIFCPQILVRYRIHSQTITSGLLYSDAARWQRWIEGTVAKYRSFRRDYERWALGSQADPKVLREIEHQMRRAEKCRDLVTGSATRRAIAAFHYSRDFKWVDRAAFVIHRAGLQNMAIIRLLSKCRRVFKIRP